MTDLNDVADRLHRTAKLAIDTGEAASEEEANRIFSGYSMQIVIGPDVAGNAVAQAALLTAVNCATRTLLGGVAVIGARGPLKVTLPPYASLAEAVKGMGARLADDVDPALPTMVLGEAEAKIFEPQAIRATFDGWVGAVAPAAGRARLAETGDFTPAGIFAGALAVSEIFQRLRGGNPYACRRAIGLNLWRPEQDWRGGDVGPALKRLPSAIWLIGLGNLGQAYLWTLGLLPYEPDTAELTLQDNDFIAPSNVSTSLLTTERSVGRRKTRVMADWAERRGFKATVIERIFRADFTVDQSEPCVALVGVDNALARQAIEGVGFARVIEAGLGKGPQDYLGIDVHTFPASKPASEIWRDTEPSDVDITQRAYRMMLEQTGDRCGTVRLAGRSIAASFVGAMAGAMVVSELLRLAIGGNRYELISCHLRDPARRAVFSGDTWQATNIGTTSPL